jgi:ATP-dependent DNA ligase
LTTCCSGFIPAASRIQKLSRQTPAVFVLFDLLVNEKGQAFIEQPLEVRRPELERFFARFLTGRDGLALSPATRDVAEAKSWFETVGGDLDGIIAKRLHVPYEPGERTAMQKIKRLRTADCVIGGFRYAENKPVIGSLLLGLYNDEGLLDHVGFCSGLKTDERRDLVQKLKPLVQPPGFTGRAPGGPSRWSTKRSQEWEPLRPELVVEVSYDHFTGGRFRHGTRLLRWRPDKAPKQCRMDQVMSAGKSPLSLLAAA